MLKNPQKIKIRNVFLFLIFVLAFGCIFLGGAKTVQATQGTASVSGNWNATTTWGGSAIPISSTAVIINEGVTVTVNTTTAVAASVVIGTNSNTATTILTFAATGSPVLTVGGTVTIGAGTSSTKGGATLTMVSGSTLIANALAVGNTASTQTFNQSTGTVQLAATNTLPATVFLAFYNLNINGSTYLHLAVGLYVAPKN